MERRNFIKRLFGIGAAAAASSVPALANVEERFTIDDMFDQVDTNKNLYYLKKYCWLHDELSKIFGDRIVDRKYFAWYYPISNIYLPIKNSYTEKDFEPILTWAKFQPESDHFCNGYMKEGKGLCRILKYDKQGVYKFDFFWARDPKYQEK